MHVLKRGHRYALDHLDGKEKTIVEYVNREPGQEREGVTQQELLRMMIDRNRYCNNCLPHPNNERIQFHLRMALALHEARALERKIEKGELDIEYVPVGNDGHFVNEVSIALVTFNSTVALRDPPPREGVCTYTSHIDCGPVATPALEDLP